MDLGINMDSVVRMWANGPGTLNWEKKTNRKIWGSFPWMGWEEKAENSEQTEKWDGSFRAEFVRSVDT